METVCIFLVKKFGMVCLIAGVIYLYMLPSDGYVYKSHWYNGSKTHAFLNYIFCWFICGWNSEYSTKYCTCKSC